MSTHIGIDVSKASFDLVIHESQQHRKFEMTKGHIRKAITFIKKQKPRLIVLEATGGYERALAADLISAKLPVSVVNPRFVRDFAKAKGILAKTDKIDAATIAHYAKVLHPQIKDALSKSQIRLKSLVARRRQLVELRMSEKNHRENVVDPDIKSSIKTVLTNLSDEIERIEKVIIELIQSDPDMQDKILRLTSVPGIGKTTAAMLMSDLPELGRLNRRQIAARVGLAPINRDSGQFRGRRMTGSGRKKVRSGLFMAMLSVIQCNPKLRAFYQRLLKTGKAKMLAITATMRKLVVILNAMIKEQQNWQHEIAFAK